ncbi:hypothetical protein RHGRI_000693 [Rhododendron griersonianum]|uniref:Uncharacterized protein n=1 Tax=Rhododendron griersonianum TaxID=479676 RepID=A0AAV6LIR0_9ERIC|nr:hypothetical protein RHGRI_000693 [Rhododendron griersonianum]
MSSGSNPGQGTPPDSPPSSSSSVREVEDPSIYFRVQRGFAYEWHVIKGGNSKTPEEDKLLGPFLPKPPTHLWDSGPPAAASSAPPYTSSVAKPTTAPSATMSTTSTRAVPPAAGIKAAPRRSRDTTLTPWRSTASCTCWESMPRRSTNASPVGLRDAATLFPIANSFPIVSGGHALSDKNNSEANKILFHCKIFPSLKPGFMFGLDVSNPENELQMVLGLDNKNSREEKPLPQPGPPESSSGPRGFLVSMGNSKLAVLWAGVIPRRPGEPRPRPDEETKLLVSCSKLEMSKRLNAQSISWRKLCLSPITMFWDPV